MFSILRNNGNFSKKLCCMDKYCIMKAFFNVRDCHTLAKISSLTYKHQQDDLQPSKLYHGQLIRLLHYKHDQNSHYRKTFLPHHNAFSKKLNSMNKDSTYEISDLVVEWLRRFNSLGSVDANSIAGALNAFSKLNIFDRRWKRGDQENFKELIVYLTAEGYELLDHKFNIMFKFSSWQVANCLNALSKWNISNPDIWVGDFQLQDGSYVTRVSLLESFVVLLIKRGIWLLDPVNKTYDKFNSQSVANCLNALSKRNIRRLQGTREFVVQLMKQSNETDSSSSSQSLENDRFTSLSVTRSLYALSQWDADELQGIGEFIVQLIKQSIEMVDEFNALEISFSFNALSKWGIDDFQNSQQFIIGLVNRGNLIVDEFNPDNIASCLNAFSKWNIYEIQGAEEFIIRLIERGNSMTDAFNPKDIGISLNAISEWDMDKLQGAREFIVELIRCANLSVNTFNPQSISNSLNALSKWNLDEIPKSKEFIVLLIAKGSQSSAGFNSQAVANCLNGLSRWNIDELEGAREFISQLIERGNSTVSGFNCQEIATSLNVLSKWNLDQLQGGREFIEKLIERGCSVADRFDPTAIGNTLNALSKWNINEFQASKEFIILLIKEGNSKHGEFNALEVSNSLNALSKWSTSDLKGSNEFIVRLTERATSIKDST